MGRPDCKGCLTANKYANEIPFCQLDPPKCFPGIHAYNEAAYTIYSHVNGQYIMSQGGPVVLDLLAIDKVFDWFGVDDEDRIDLHAQVQRLSSVAISTQYSEAERNMKMAEAKRR